MAEIYANSARYFCCVCTEEKHVNTMQAFVHIQRLNIKLPGIEVGYAVWDFQAELLCWHTWTDVCCVFTELALIGISCRPYINLPAGDIGSAICSHPKLPPTLLDAEKIEISWQTPTTANIIWLYHYCNRHVATLKTAYGFPSTSLPLGIQQLDEESGNGGTTCTVWHHCCKRY